MGHKPVRGKIITNTTGRVLVVGDPHGCYDECVELLDQWQATSKDTIIFAGDMTDRGPESGKCVDLSKAHEGVLGNHDKKHLSYWLQILRGDKLEKVPDHHAKTMSQLNEDHYAYLESMPHFIRLPQYNSVVVHAGVFPGRTIEEQDLDHVLRIQYINPAVSTKSYWSIKRPVHSKENEQEVMYDPSFKFWTHWWDGPERIIFGHSVLNKPLITDKFVGIDGGCCFGEELWAWDCTNDMLVALPSRQVRTERPKLHYIHGDIGTY
jgi:predicted phosphodiesterase